MRMRDSNAGGQGPRRKNQRDECQNGEGVLKALDSRDAIDLERPLATEGDAPAASVRVDGRTPREWSRHAFVLRTDPVATSACAARSFT